MPTKKEKLVQAIRDGKVRDATTASVFNMVEDLNERLDEEIPQIKNILKKVKGDIGPEGKQGNPGKDGKDGKSIIGPKGNDGKDGKNGVDGVDGETPVIDTSKITLEASNRAYNELLPKIPTIEDIANQIPVLGEDVRNALENLTGSERLDASAIKNLPEIPKGGGGGGSTARFFYQLYDSGSYVGHGGEAVYVKSDASGLEYKVAVSSDEKVKYDSGDPTAGYLGAKVVAGTDITLSEGTGADENKLKISYSGTPMVYPVTGTATYTVTYNGNGNTGGTAPTDASSPYEADATVTVLGNTGSLVKTGYSFNGWNTAANGSGTSYAPAATFSMPSANVTLYAQWNLTHKYQNCTIKNATIK